MGRFSKKRTTMINSHLMARGITDEKVLEIMQTVPRHLFVDECLQGQAYSDNSLPIGSRQTISQPYVVGLMTEALELRGTEKVLEIGTGCGYQTAILAGLAEMVFSIERMSVLAFRAQRTLDSLHYYNILIRVGDGTYGWSDESPFDAIIVTAGAPKVPETLKKQLAVGGRLVIPVGNQSSQTLLRVTRLSEKPDNIKIEELCDCHFVDLIGEHGWKG
ncbi:MAG: protein-L-isoaspartate(D-aspartate) O-methyltransferase [Thermodesulfobacteriota bacterium]|nr:protein-L-isoaspartate(D-aspartate) O-methyltransferase [Thermodesulfobacteriota bacterium]